MNETLARSHLVFSYVASALWVFEPVTSDKIDSQAATSPSIQTCMQAHTRANTHTHTHTHTHTPAYPFLSPNLLLFENSCAVEWSKNHQLAGLILLVFQHNHTHIHMNVHTVYIRHLSREITIHKVIYGVYIRFWPTLSILHSINLAPSRTYWWGTYTVPNTKVAPFPL